MRDDQRPRILDVTPEGELQFAELSLGDQLLRHEALAQILDEVEHDRSAPVPGWIDVDQRCDLDVEQASVAQQSGKLPADEVIDPVQASVLLEELRETGPG